ncbi:MAG: hypothetical protein V3S48_05120 [Candidatus Neomarinimicrobiota bacterium]
MEPLKLYFDFRDIFRSPRLALSGKKIWIFLTANLIGFSVYFILNYLGYLASGLSLVNTWNNYGLYPCLAGTGSPWFSMLLFWIGTIFWFLAISMACTAVARVTYKQLKGDEFYSSFDGWKYVKKHWHPVVFTSLSIFLIICFFIIMAALFALLGKIPFIGEYLFVLPYLLYFFGAVFTIYTAVVFIISFIYTPAITAALEEDTMGAVFNSYSLTWSQPWRILTYHLVLLPLLTLSVSVFKYFWLGGFKFINAVFGHASLMGEKLSNITGTAAGIIWPNRLTHLFSHNSGFGPKGSYYGEYHGSSETCFSWFCDSSFPTAGDTLSGSEWGAAVILSFFLFILTLSVFSYALSILSVGETIMLIIFRKKSDDDNILERKDEEDLEAEEEDEDFDVENETNNSTSENDSDDTGPGSGPERKDGK